MIKEIIKLEDYTVPVYRLNTVIVGSGASGYNAADRLLDSGQRDIALVTEDVMAGTSRNTGSDKQTYYKLSLSGDDLDSVRMMAETLYSGHGVDGDLALCEAALSAQGFFRLVELGVPFPKNRYGEYIGYKTDHDPRRRATSVGPYTSKRMTECLEESAAKKGLIVFDGLQVIRVISDKEKAYGLICIDRAAPSLKEAIVIFNCKNIVYATGGPAGMYANSVYPVGQHGASGLAFEAGVKGKNLTEWQYGLASINPRWNVSGTYMQVLPRFISTDQDGGDAKEFLIDFFEDRGDMLSKVFLKGYQWPFDVRKVDDGSSIIDILVYLESKNGRRIYLDFRENPNMESIDFSSLSEEARSYLEKAGACFGNPIDRLMHMNAPAVEFYRDHGIDLRSQPLEIALCAQHNNGGLSIDCWWQTNLEGFFAIGEVSASHGVYRPGGSALNAGQVGGIRCSQYIAAHRRGAASEMDLFSKLAQDDLTFVCGLSRKIFQAKQAGNIKALWNTASTRMDRVGAAIRDEVGIRATLNVLREELNHFDEVVKVQSVEELAAAWHFRDALICQLVYLSAMTDYIAEGGASRGSALYSDPKGKKPYSGLPDVFTFSLDDGSRSHLIQEVLLDGMQCHFEWRHARPMPEDDDFFENVWRRYREDGNVY